MPFGFWVRLPPVLAEGGILYLLRVISKRSLTPVLYALSPLAIVISSYHGQFDSVVLFFLVLAVHLSYRQRITCSGLALAAAIALKSWPVMLLPTFLLHIPRQRHRFVFAALAVVPTLVLITPFLISDKDSILRELFGYSGVLDHGLGIIIRLVRAVAPETPTAGLAKLLFALGYGLVLLSIREHTAKDDLVTHLTLIIMIFYATYPGISGQYMLWLLPFLVIQGNRQTADAIVYSVVPTIAVLAGFRFHEYNLPSYSFLWAIPSAVAGVLWVGGSLFWWYLAVRWSITILCRRVAGRDQTQSIQSQL